jgi:hypothetical protein
MSGAGRRHRPKKGSSMNTLRDKVAAITEGRLMGRDGALDMADRILAIPEIAEALAGRHRYEKRWAFFSIPTKP